MGRSALVLIILVSPTRGSGLDDIAYFVGDPVEFLVYVAIIYLVLSLAHHVARRRCGASRVCWKAR